MPGPMHNNEWAGKEEQKHVTHKRSSQVTNNLKSSIGGKIDQITELQN